MESLFKVGVWTYHPEDLVVRCKGVRGACDFFINLESCTTSGEMLFLIFHVSTKRWATNEVIGDLVEILEKLLRPKLTLGFGGGPLPTGDAMRELIANHLIDDIEGKETFYRAAMTEGEDWQSLLQMEKDDLPRSGC